MAHTPDPVTTNFVDLVMAAYHRADIPAERLSETVVRVPLPEDDHFWRDYADEAEQARPHPPEQHPRMADKLVEATTRIYRERGIRLGNHYPPLSGDHGRQSLITAFEHMGMDARFEFPWVLSVPLPGGGRGEIDVRPYLVTVVDASPEQASEDAGRFAWMIAQQLSQGKAPAERLRVQFFAFHPVGAAPEDVLAETVAREIVPGLLWQTVNYPRGCRPLTRQAHERSGRSTEEAFAEGVSQALSEPVEVTEHEVDGVRIIHVGGQHSYVLAQVHALGRHVGEAPHGALVALPQQRVVLAHPLGRGNPVLAMERLQELAERYEADAHHPISSQLFWWRPGSGTETDVPSLSAVAIEVDQETTSFSLHTSDDEFGPLLERLMSAETG